MSQKSINQILGSQDGLSPELKAVIAESFEARVAEMREELASTIRQEFAERYDVAHAELVEAMDKMMTEAIRTELEEFATDRKAVVEQRIKYKKAIKEHAQVLDKFITETLSKEVKELREDRKAVKKDMALLEEFVIKNLTSEMKELKEGRDQLAAQRVKIIREGKKQIAAARVKFIKEGAAKLDKLMSGALKGELTQLRESIEKAANNDFGRRIVEAFATEFMASPMAAGTAASKLSKQVEELSIQLAESKKQIAAREKMLTESKKQVKAVIAESQREKAMSKLLSPLSAEQKGIMTELLESVSTDRLETAFKRYLPSVISEKAVKRVNKENESKVLSESSRTVTGDKIVTEGTNTVVNADIIELRKRAGIQR